MASDLLLAAEPGAECDGGNGRKDSLNVTTERCAVPPGLARRQSATAGLLPLVPLLVTWFGLSTALLERASAQGQSSSICDVQPRYGSVMGGTMVTITPCSGHKLGNPLSDVQVHIGTDECDVQRHKTSPQVIACTTRSNAGVERWYQSISIRVDGDVVPIRCSRCTFTFRNWYYTPTVDSVKPFVARAGTILTIVGHFFDALVDGALVTNNDYETSRTLSRVMVGNESCRLLDPATGEPYGSVARVSSLRNRGIVKCQLQNRLSGSYDVRVLVSNIGWSKYEYNAVQVDGQEQPYALKNMPVIRGIIPPTGSLQGGSQVTVVGEGLRAYSAGNTTVTIDGKPCKVTRTSAYFVQCTTPVLRHRITSYSGDGAGGGGSAAANISGRSSPTPEQNSFPGGTGWRLEVYNYSAQSFPDAQQLNTSNFPDHRVFTVNTLDNLIPVVRSFVNDTFTLRLSGYFVAPHSSHFQFLASGKGRVYLLRYATHGYEVGELLRNAGNGWSHRVYLKKGQALYLEVIQIGRVRDGTVRVRAYMRNTTVTPLQSRKAVASMQKLVLAHGQLTDTQRVSFHDVSTQQTIFFSLKVPELVPPAWLRPFLPQQFSQRASQGPHSGESGRSSSRGTATSPGNHGPNTQAGPGHSTQKQPGPATQSTKRQPRPTQPYGTPSSQGSSHSSGSGGGDGGSSSSDDEHKCPAPTLSKHTEQQMDLLGVCTIVGFNFTHQADLLYVGLLAFNLSAADVLLIETFVNATIRYVPSTWNNNEYPYSTSYPGYSHTGDSGKGQTTPGPNGFTQRPGGSTQGPGGSTQGPGGHTQGPGGHTQGPGGHTQGSGGHTQGPGGHTQGPGGFTQGPGGHTQGPGGSTQRPGGHTQRPGGHTQGHTQGPGGPTQGPGGPTQGPGGPTQGPGGPTQGPGGYTQGPGGPTQSWNTSPYGSGGDGGGRSQVTATASPYHTSPYNDGDNVAEQKTKWLVSGWLPFPKDISIAHDRFKSEPPSSSDLEKLLKASTPYSAAWSAQPGQSGEVHSAAQPSWSVQQPWSSNSAAGGGGAGGGEAVHSDRSDSGMDGPCQQWMDMARLHARQSNGSLPHLDPAQLCQNMSGDNLTVCQTCFLCARVERHVIDTNVADNVQMLRQDYGRAQHFSLSLPGTSKRTRLFNVFSPREDVEKDLNWITGSTGVHVEIEDGVDGRYWRLLFPVPSSGSADIPTVVVSVLSDNHHENKSAPVNADPGPLSPPGGNRTAPWGNFTHFQEPGRNLSRLYLMDWPMHVVDFVSKTMCKYAHVNKTQSGQRAKDQPTLNLSWTGAPSAFSIGPQSTSGEVLKALQAGLSSRCRSSDSGSVLFATGYEQASSSSLPNEHGTVDASGGAFCGQSSVRGPSLGYIFQAGVSKSQADGRTVSVFRASMRKYRWICAAWVSDANPGTSLHLSYSKTPECLPDSQSDCVKSVTLLEQFDDTQGKWRYDCLNIFDEVFKEDLEKYNNGLPGYELPPNGYLHSISVKNSDKFQLDEVSIRTDRGVVQQIEAGYRPGGEAFRSFQVAKATTSSPPPSGTSIDFDITVETSNCAALPSDGVPALVTMHQHASRVVHAGGGSSVSGGAAGGAGGAGAGVSGGAGAGGVSGKGGYSTPTGFQPYRATTTAVPSAVLPRQQQQQQYAERASDSASAGALASPPGIKLSRPVKAINPYGYFILSYQGNLSKPIPVGVDTDKLQAYVNLVPGLEEVVVKRAAGIDDCFNRTFSLEWKTVGGYKPLLGIQYLDGSQTNVQVRAGYDSPHAREGSLSIDPIAADMLQTRHTTPQVIVKVGGTPAECFSDDCSFAPDISSTPSITGVTPSYIEPVQASAVTPSYIEPVQAGAQPVEINIQGTGFGANSTNVKVWLAAHRNTSGGHGPGEYDDHSEYTANPFLPLPCVTTMVTDFDILCQPPALLAAGLYDVHVTVLPAGVALRNITSSSASFGADGPDLRAWVNLTSLHPSSGPIAGGTLVTIVGAGFSAVKEEVGVVIGNTTVQPISANWTHVLFETPHGGDTAGPTTVSVTVNSVEARQALSYHFNDTADDVVIVSGVSPASGAVYPGTHFTVHGKFARSCVSYYVNETATEYIVVAKDDGFGDQYSGSGGGGGGGNNDSVSDFASGSNYTGGSWNDTDSGFGSGNDTVSNSSTFSNASSSSGDGGSGSSSSGNGGSGSGSSGSGSIVGGSGSGHKQWVERTRLVERRNCSFIVDLGGGSPRPYVAVGDWLCRIYDVAEHSLYCVVTDKATPLSSREQQQQLSPQTSGSANEKNQTAAYFPSEGSSSYSSYSTGSDSKQTHGQGKSSETLKVRVVIPGVGQSVCGRVDTRRNNTSLSRNDSNPQSNSSGSHSNSSGSTTIVYIPCRHGRDASAPDDCSTSCVFHSTAPSMSGISPRTGSILGGTLLRIHGSGFPTDKRLVKVTLGSLRSTGAADSHGNSGVECPIVAAQHDEITCRTPPRKTHHIVTNTGRHPVIGKGYAWNPPALEIHPGDSVTFKWEQHGSAKTPFNILQTAGPSPLDGHKPPRAFQSGTTASLSGNYTVHLWALGKYMYKSAPPLPNGDTASGTIIVIPRTVTNITGPAALFALPGLLATNSSGYDHESRFIVVGGSSRSVRVYVRGREVAAEPTRLDAVQRCLHLGQRDPNMPQLNASVRLLRQVYADHVLRSAQQNPHVRALGRLLLQNATYGNVTDDDVLALQSLSAFPSYDGHSGNSSWGNSSWPWGNSSWGNSSWPWGNRSWPWGNRSWGNSNSSAAGGSDNSTQLGGGGTRISTHNSTHLRVEMNNGSTVVYVASPPNATHASLSGALASLTMLWDMVSRDGKVLAAEALKGGLEQVTMAIAALYRMSTTTPPIAYITTHDMRAVRSCFSARNVTWDALFQRADAASVLNASVGIRNATQRDAAGAAVSHAAKPSACTPVVLFRDWLWSLLLSSGSISTTHHQSDNEYRYALNSSHLQHPEQPGSGGGGNDSVSSKAANSSIDAKALRQWLLNSSVAGSRDYPSMNGSIGDYSIRQWIMAIENTSAFVSEGELEKRSAARELRGHAGICHDALLKITLGDRHTWRQNTLQALLAHLTAIQPGGSSAKTRDGEWWPEQSRSYDPASSSPHEQHSSSECSGNCSWSDHRGNHSLCNGSSPGRGCQHDHHQHNESSAGNGTFSYDSTTPASERFLQMSITSLLTGDKFSLARVLLYTLQRTPDLKYRNAAVTAAMPSSYDTHAHDDYESSSASWRDTLAARLARVFLRHLVSSVMTEAYGKCSVSSWPPQEGSCLPQISDRKDVLKYMVRPAAASTTPSSSGAHVGVSGRMMDWPDRSDVRFQFLYDDVCSTPSVFAVDDFQDLLYLDVSIGDALPCHLSVRVGSEAARCHIVYASARLIVCKPVMSWRDSVLVAYPVRLFVEPYGQALPRVSHFASSSASLPGNLTYSFHPVVEAVSPAKLSLGGGGLLHIRGRNLVDVRRLSRLNVTLLGTVSGVRVNCMVVKANLSDVMCRLESSGRQGTHPADTYYVRLEMSVQGYPQRESYRHVCSADACLVKLSRSATSLVTVVSPATVNSTDHGTLFTLRGHFPTGNLSNYNRHGNDDLVVRIGRRRCRIIELSNDNTNGDNDIIVCMANSTIVSGVNRVDVSSTSLGDGVSNATVISNGKLTLSSSTSSIHGGLRLVVRGAGFDCKNSSLAPSLSPLPPLAAAAADNDSLLIEIGGKPCRLVDCHDTYVTCITPPHDAGVYNLVVYFDGAAFSLATTLAYNSSSKATPAIASTSVSEARGGENVTVFGSGLNGGTLTISIGGVKVTAAAATLHASAASQVVIRMPALVGGTYNVSGLVDGKGKTNNDVVISAPLVVMAVTPSLVSLAGGANLTVFGYGFQGENAARVGVTVCAQPCSTVYVSSAEELHCVAPPVAVRNNGNNDDNRTCHVTVTTPTASATLNGSVTYSSSVSPVVHSVSPTRGGTGGGTLITIAGSGFANGSRVTINGSDCEIFNVTSTAISCYTGQHRGTVTSAVQVLVPGLGLALNPGHNGGDGVASFFYVDVWSSPFTWGLKSPPGRGDLVVVEAGQTILLDTSTAVLKALLVKGGALVFDHDADDIVLRAENIIVTEGGRIEIGTERRPFLNRASIMMYGHRLSTEIPLYGAKTLAVRHGTLDVHGRPMNVTWTKLAVTAHENDTSIELVDAVDWEVGGKVAIAATGHHPHENEERTIAAVLDGGRRLELTEPLRYRHISLVQTLAEKTVETRGEVGYLTRNVVIEGNRDATWDQEIDACPRVFDAGQFARQTCFQGRYGAETDSDQFGSHVILFADKPVHGRIVGRFSYAEVRHAGQAFMLGRYPIHFHMSGDVNGSYVRGCAVHHTFNRAVTIHGVHNLLVEENVAFHNMGHAFFLEDGIETGTLIKHNLGIFTQSSSSLLNVDVTPATYWITNPLNRVVDNAAAGGTHFGYWFRLPEHPEGPSFDASVCVRVLPLIEFRGNSAHSYGRYGLWVFREWFPRRSGGCSGAKWRAEETAHLRDFTVWNTERGVEVSTGGAIQFVNMTSLDNRDSGVEFHKLVTTWQVGTAGVRDSLVVGYSNVSREGDWPRATKHGSKSPSSSYYTVRNTTMLNFNMSGSVAFAACGDCKPEQGGFESRYSGIRYLNSPNQVGFKWQHEAIFSDQDGTLSGRGRPGSIVPTCGLYNPATCHRYASGYTLPENMFCEASEHFFRVRWIKPKPVSLEGRGMTLQSQFGHSSSNYFKRLPKKVMGWMAILASGYTYEIGWKDSPLLTNVSYTAEVSEVKTTDSVVIRHEVAQQIDQVQILNGVKRNATLGSLANAGHGDWNQRDETRHVYRMINGTNRSVAHNASYISYAVTGEGVDESRACCKAVNYKIYQCYYPHCAQGPKQVEVDDRNPPARSPGSNNTVLWSDLAAKYPLEFPPNTRDAVINATHHVIVDVGIPALASITIYGTLEFNASMDHTLRADFIFVYGGSLIAGNETHPFSQKLRIVLTGNVRTPEVFLPNGINYPAKSLAVFGSLRLFGATRTVVRSWCAADVSAGSRTITVMDRVDWQLGDEVVVGPTGFESAEAEKHVVDRVSADGLTLTLQSPLRYAHAGGHDGEFFVAAVVVLLTRNIVIDGGDKVAKPNYFGGRVDVGNLGYVSRDTGRRRSYRGLATLVGVELVRCGQESYTDDDPFASALSHRAAIVLASYSSMERCSVHNSLNTAIGTYGTRYVNLTDNVVYSTVGTSVRVSGIGHRLHGNTAVRMRFPPTYDGRTDQSSLHYPSLYDLRSSRLLSLENNVGAGSERLGFHIDGEPCPTEVNLDGMPDADPVTRWHGNSVMATLQGVHIGAKDGLKGCSLVSGFTTRGNYELGVFAYTTSMLVFNNLSVYDNGAGLVAIVYRPTAIRHVTSNKRIYVMNSVIAPTSGSPTRACSMARPAAANHERVYAPPSAPGSGRPGLVTSSFNSAKNRAPKSDWIVVDHDPAISGETDVYRVRFTGFKDRQCGRRNAHDVAIMSNPKSDDAQHPMNLIRCTVDNTLVNNTLYYHNPRLAKVNPSDCVDMDCDGLKHSLVTDVTGEVFGGRGVSVIGRAEFEWNGDRRRGLGDYRIPKALLTAANGSKLDVAAVVPHKGVVRGNRTHSACTWNAAWNAHRCHDLQHKMIVIESLDGDTQVRRLSPVSLSAAGYIDLLNGPQDHGWCDGYTCQERISTFFGLVARNLHYTVHFSSTGPERMRVHVLNGEPSHAIRVSVFQSAVQRYDIYSNGRLVPATNQQRNKAGKLVYIRKDPNLPDDQLIPKLGTHPHASNYMDRDTKLLHVIVNSSVGPVEIRRVAAVVLDLEIPTEVTVDEFFAEKIVRNLAALLKVPESKIRLVDVVSERSSSGRTRRATAGTQKLQFIIADDAEEVIAAPLKETVNGTTDDTASVASTTQSVPVSSSPANVSGNPFAATSPSSHLQHTGISSPTAGTVDATAASSSSILQLEGALETFVTALQSNQLSASLNVSVVGATVTEPVKPPPPPPPLATNESVSAAAVNATNQTIAARQLQDAESEVAAVSDIVLSVPNSMVIDVQPSARVAEGVVFPSQPSVSVLDSSGGVVRNLGLSSSPWRLRVSLASGGSGLRGTTEIAFAHGHANYTDLYIDSPDVSAELRFDVVSPASVAFTAVSSNIVTVKRSIEVHVTNKPAYVVSDIAAPSGTPASVFAVEIRDTVTHARVTDHGWQPGRRWFITPTLLSSGDLAARHVSVRSGATSVELRQGYANFSRLILAGYGTGAQLIFQLSTTPTSTYSGTLLISEKFEVRQSSNITLTFQADYNDVVLGRLAEFKADMKRQLDAATPGYTNTILDVRAGSVIVESRLTAESGNRTASDGVANLNNVIASGRLTVISNGINLGSPHLDNSTEPSQPPPDDDDTDSGMSTGVMVTLIIMPILVMAVVFIMVAVITTKKSNGGRRRGGARVIPNTGPIDSDSASVTTAESQPPEYTEMPMLPLYSPGSAASMKKGKQQKQQDDEEEDEAAALPSKRRIGSSRGDGARRRSSNRSARSVNIAAAVAEDADAPVAPDLVPPTMPESAETEKPVKTVGSATKAPLIPFIINDGDTGSVAGDDGFAATATATTATAVPRAERPPPRAPSVAWSEASDSRPFSPFLNPDKPS